MAFRAFPAPSRFSAPPATDSLVFEDSAVGVAAAEAAGAAIVVITAAHRRLMHTSHPTVNSFSGFTTTIAEDGTLQVDAFRRSP